MFFFVFFCPSCQQPVHKLDVIIYFSSAALTPEIPPLLENCPSIPLRVLPSMTLRAFRNKVVKASKSPTRITTVMLWLKMADGTFALLDKDHEDHDLAWWGFENGSELIYHAE
jgi:hypothetical protein